MSTTVSTKHLVTIFFPTIILLGVILMITIRQYEPLYPQVEPSSTASTPTPSIPLLPDDPILGNKKAGHTIVIFGDFGCEACHTQMNMLMELVKTHGQKIKIFWKGLPATRVPYPSDTAHRYAYCANKQGLFLPFATSTFTGIDNLIPENLVRIAAAIGMNPAQTTMCVDSPDTKQYITDTQTIATELHIQSVPTIFFDNIQIQPPSTLDGWKALVL
jgi:protein-disulfide isomerase